MILFFYSAQAITDFKFLWAYSSVEAFRMHLEKSITSKSGKQMGHISSVFMCWYPGAYSPCSTIHDIQICKITHHLNVASINFSLIFSLLNVPIRNSHEFLSTHTSVLIPLFLRNVSIRIQLINKRVEEITLNNFILEWIILWKYQQHMKHTQRTYAVKNISVQWNMNFYFSLCLIEKDTSYSSSKKVK